MEQVVKSLSERNVTRTELAEAVYAAASLPRKEAYEFVDQVLREIVAALVRDGVVNLRNFGVFTVRETPERLGRNPTTKQEYVISRRRAISFKAAPALKQKINARNEPID